MKIDRKSIFGFLIIAFLLLICVFAIAKFVGFFSGATDTVKAASLTAIVTVTVFTVGKYFEQRREAKIKINSEKTEVYRKFFVLYFDFFSYEKIHGKPKEPKQVLVEMLEFQTNVILWGSDQVIKSWLDFKDELSRFTSIPINSQSNMHANLAGVFNSAAMLLSSMRRDIGYSFTNFTASDLARLQMTTDDDSKKMLAMLKGKP